MSWLYERTLIPSVKNGPITVSRKLGVWSIHVGGYDETTPYTEHMWQRALLELPRTFRPKRILMLGLGAGATVGTLQEYFPQAHITAIEWDEVMVAIAKRCALFVFNEKLSILLGDATALVPTLTDTYDFILIDLFKGKEVAPILTDPSFANHLTKLLSPSGHLVANIFHTPERLAAFDQTLAHKKLWRYKYNRVAFYEHHGRGTIGDPLPHGFMSHRQSRLYLTYNDHGEIVGEQGCLGTRNRRGPIYFESYTTDTEPKPQKQWGIGIIKWQPLSITQIPHGWHRMKKPFIKQTGFAEIKNPIRYWDAWTDHAKRHRTKWLNKPLYPVEVVGAQEFMGAYRRESHLFVTKYPFLGILRHDAKHHGERLVCFGARDSDGTLVAGLAVLNLPDANTSSHTISFIAKRARHTSVGTALIDAWFQNAIANSIRFLNFGTFWAPGDPPAWRGFSQFKAQFGIHFIRYPHQLFKIMR